VRKFLLILVCVSSSAAIAEPSRSVQYLMTEPVTLFDQGLQRLGVKLNEVLLRTDFPEIIGNLSITSKSEIAADYDWKSNRITIYGSVQHDSKTANPTTLLDLCGRVVERMRFNLGYGEMGTRFRNAGLMQGVSIHFQHRGYQKKDEPSTLETDLASIIAIRIISFANKDNKRGLFGNSDQLTCIGNLLDSEITIVTKPVN
jgi:hypothetical protein